MSKRKKEQAAALAGATACGTSETGEPQLKL